MKPRNSVRLYILLWKNYSGKCSKGHLGRRDEAAAALGEVYRLFPEFGPAYVAATYPFRNASDSAMFAEGLRRAGWTG